MKPWDNLSRGLEKANIEVKDLNNATALKALKAGLQNKMTRSFLCGIGVTNLSEAFTNTLAMAESK